MGAFQQYVPNQPAPGEAGDFAGTNPRASQSAPSNGWRAAPSYPTPNGNQLAVIIGNFAWGVPSNGDPTVPGTLSSYYRAGALLGFVHRENQGLLTKFLQENVLAVQDGYPCYSMSRGEFWANFAAGAVRGQKVYADPLTGAVSAGAPGAGVQFAITASLANSGVLTVTVTGGVLAAGQVITGAGVPDGSYIVSQLTGSAGSTGTYQLNQGATVGSEAMTATGVIETPFYVSQTTAETASVTGSIAAQTGVLTVTAVGSGALEPGQFITWAGCPTQPPVRISAQLTGTPGGDGDYQTTYVNYPVVNSTTVTASSGQLAKISTWQTN